MENGLENRDDDVKEYIPVKHFSLTSCAVIAGNQVPGYIALAMSEKISGVIEGLIKKVPLIRGTSVGRS